MPPDSQGYGDLSVNVLVTAGPTQEYIDDVRYITSPSTGKMGFAVAQAFAAAGHTVTLVTGPVTLADPPGVKVTRVVTAVEMHDAVMELLGGVDVVVMTAAVGDYRPAERFKGKRKLTGEKLLLELVENPDILREVGKQGGSRILVGFAVESSSPRQGALEKLRKKNLDFIVLNAPSAFGADVTSVDIIDRDERTTPMHGVSKRAVAERLRERVEEFARTRR
jgi:phosphopantothenoylcysteine decarboxylase / phosphopantothenate---cysteine ligase